MNELPSEVSVSIEGEVYREKRDERAEEKFGPDFAGKATFKWPTFGDRTKIAARVTATFELMGVRDPAAVPLVAYRVVEAFAFFDELKTKDGLPEWLTATKRATPKGEAAILRIYDLAQAKLEDVRGKSAGDGGA